MTTARPDPAAHTGPTAPRNWPTPPSELGVDRVWQMLESAPDGMLLVDASGSILAANRQIERLFGFDRGDVLGRSVDMLVPERFQTGHAALRDRFRADPRLRELGKGLQLFARRSDGTEFPVDISLSPLRDDEGFCVVATIRDVTERQRVARRLELSEATFRASFEQAPVGMVIARVHPDGHSEFEQVNDSFGRMLGRSTDSLVGFDFADLAHDADRDEVLDMGAALVRGDRDASVAERRYRRADGSFVWAFVHESVIDRDEAVRTLTHVVDVTDRREREAAHERMAMMEDRERIARDIHDLVIQRLFGTGMKLQAVVPEMQSETAVARAHETIDELDAAIRELRSSIFSLHRRDERLSVSDDLRRAIDQSARSSGAELSFNVSGPLDRLSDRLAAELKATTTEALSNAVRHAAASVIDVSVTVTNDEVALAVTDDGRGIGDARSAGNGLTNLADRAERLGGSFDVQSPMEGGCTLSWRVPLP